MSVRVRFSIEASVSSTSAEEKDLGNLAMEVVNDTQGEGGVRKTTLAPGATDVSVMLTEVTSATFVLIRTNAKDPTETLTAITIKLDDVGSDPITLTPLSGSTEAHMLLVASGITDIFASNAGSINIEITVMAVGD